MLQLVLFILGIVYLLRRPRLARLRAESFPTVAEGDFLRWKRLELTSIDIFLWTVFGVSFAGCGLSALLRTSIQQPARVGTSRADAWPMEMIVLQAGCLAVFLIGLLISAIYGSRAARLKRSLGIRWSTATQKQPAMPVPAPEPQRPWPERRIDQTVLTSFEPGCCPICYVRITRHTHYCERCGADLRHQDNRPADPCEGAISSALHAGAGHQECNGPAKTGRAARRCVGLGIAAWCFACTAFILLRVAHLTPGSQTAALIVLGVCALVCVILTLWCSLVAMRRSRRDRRLAFVGCGFALACLVMLGGTVAHTLFASNGAPQVARHSLGLSDLARPAPFRTRLLRRGPAPQTWKPERPPPDVREVTYRSGNLDLKAWVYVPPVGASKKCPALVYFHGGFAFGSGDLDVCQPFIGAGFVVMTPMLRGENGNPGDFELLCGEVDDAKAAICWLAQQPFVDSSHIYAFGHSVGGGISALLSLREDEPLRHSGSAGGLYPPEAFREWAQIVPFDYANPRECDLRILRGHITEMKSRHYAYIGNRDPLSLDVGSFKAEMAKTDSKLTIISAPGNHHASLEPAMRQYLALIQKELREGH